MIYFSVNKCIFIANDRIKTLSYTYKTCILTFSIINYFFFLTEDDDDDDSKHKTTISGDRGILTHIGVVVNNKKKWMRTYTDDFTINSIYFFCTCSIKFFPRLAIDVKFRYNVKVNIVEWKKKSLEKIEVIRKAQNKKWMWDDLQNYINQDKIYYVCVCM